MSTAVAAAEQPTQPQTVRSKLDAFMGSLAKRNENLATLLTDSGIDPAKFLEVGRRAITNNPDLLNCTTASLMQAFINAATDGLPPDGRMGAIVIYKRKDGSKEAQWQPMYQGLLSVAYRSGNFTSIEARVVYAGDEFSYRLGDDPFIHHVPKPRPSGVKPAIVNSYAVARTINGGVFREVFEADDIRKVNAVSRATNGPGKDWPEEMARKGPLRRMWKYLPKDKGMERIADHDNETYDLEAVRTDAHAGPKLAPGFRPALVHDTTGAMEPMDLGAGREAEVSYSVREDEPQQQAREHEAAGSPGAQGVAETSPPNQPDGDFPGDLPAGMKRGSDLLKERGAAAPAAEDDPLDPMEWQVEAMRYIKQAGTVEIVDGLFEQWTAEGRLDALKRVSKPDWKELCDAGNARAAELKREGGA